MKTTEEEQYLTMGEVTDIDPWRPHQPIRKSGWYRCHARLEQWKVTNLQPASVRLRPAYFPPLPLTTAATCPGCHQQPVCSG